MVNKTILAAVVAAFVLGTAGAASAQIVYGQPASGNTGFSFTSWKSKTGESETTLTQFWIPVNGFVPLAENFEGRFWVATANNKLKVGNSDASLFGLGDFRLQFSKSFAEDQLVAAFGVNLPTGKKKLASNSEETVDERRVMEQLAQSYIEVPMRRYGEGFGFNAMLGAAGSNGNLSFGGGARYEFIGKYDPYENLTGYDPGDMFTIYGGGDLQTDNAVWTLNLMFVTYLKDKLDGKTAFKQGAQFDIQFAGKIGPDNRHLDFSADYLIRGRNSSYDLANENLIEQLKLYGNEFNLSADYVYQWPSKWYVVPSASLKLVAANEAIDKLDNSSVFGFGGALGKQLNEQVSFELGARYYTGSADGGNIDLTGFQFTGGLSASF